MSDIAVATGLERSVFISIPKKRNAKECSNYCTTVVISHPSKVMLKILQAKLQQYVNWELSNVQAGFGKGRGTRDQIVNIWWSIEKAREVQKNIYSASMTMLKPLIMWITTNCKGKILKEMGIPDYLTCLLKNLHAGQEATVRTGHGRTDQFQTGKGVCQGCILLPFLLSCMWTPLCEMLGWMKHKLESRLPGEMSRTSVMQMTPP